ncbi:hypothetical protein EBZ80_13190 [bacterium]|nr:hypothetical protein [bacterium]
MTRDLRKKLRIVALTVLCASIGYLTNCGKGNGTRDFLPDFSDRGSIFAPGRGAVEFLNNCFNLPPGEIAEFVGWMSARLKLDALSAVCSGLADSGFAEGVSTTREPADIN